MYILSNKPFRLIPFNFLRNVQNKTWQILKYFIYRLTTRMANVMEPRRIFRYYTKGMNSNQYVFINC
jgi:hypothetical protein